MHKNDVRTLDSIYRTIDDYYTKKVSQHGPTPLGVDWTCVATQELRFVQLLKVCSFNRPISLNDIGCGYGALLNYLSRRHAKAKIDYLGIDVSRAMIARARRMHAKRPKTRFLVDTASPRIADYSVASGIFNVKLRQDIKAWEHFIAKALIDLKETSRCGFAVNFMLPEERGHIPNRMLYRTKPERWVAFCEAELNCDVASVKGYGLREFTLLVRPTK
ncbi:MAG TPA: class I SAM-dependent methyltransferase [Xanthobacteraceae bacterium]|nr:class I SAM-dependent methyltransferase [Xanthobacteraceae bacterium]